MMNHFQQTLTVAASSADVYAALSTMDGVRGWWSQDSDGSSAVGGTIHFRFGTCFNDMRVERLEPGREVRWHCTRAHTVGDAVLQRRRVGRHRAGVSPERGLARARPGSRSSISAWCRRSNAMVCA
ncbi:hypothetical protein LP420_09885 [Massilia sp. B-10]|nr:hypothetical protein LP420_09885 [Massilia sp. B-10]